MIMFLHKRDSCLCSSLNACVCWYPTLGASWEKFETGFCIRSSGRDGRKCRHSKLVGGRCDMQGNLRWRLVLGGYETSSSPHLPHRTVKVYAEALTGFHLAHSSDGLNNTSLYLKAVSLKQLLVWDRWAEHIFQVQGRG